MKIKNLAVFFVAGLFVFLMSGLKTFGESVPSDTPTPTSAVQPTAAQSSDQSEEEKRLSEKIKDLEGKIRDLKSQEDTLSSQIDVMDNQIQLTQYKINKVEEQIIETNADISAAGGKIKHLEGSLSDVTKVLLSRIVATYQAGEIDPIQVLLASNNLRDFLNRENYLRIVQQHDKELLYNTQQAKVDYANQKNILENKKKQIVALQAQLEDYNNELDEQKDQKQKLLAETQGSEDNYQRILADTRAQLASFSKFVTSQGGASLLSGQTACDDWGCYYNQRDSQWGANSLNGTGYTLADSGCLITSVAMIYTHYGHKDVTPQSINSISSNFGGIPPALLKYSISANGISSQRVSTAIDSALSDGTPVIVGISYDGGPLPDHFLVLVSGSNGNYKMNDPYTPNAHNIPFTDKYSVGSIREINKVIM